MDLNELVLIHVPDWSDRSRSLIDDDPLLNRDIAFITYYDEDYDEGGYFEEDDGRLGGPEGDVPLNILTSSKRSSFKRYNLLNEYNDTYDWYVNDRACAKLNWIGVK